MEELQRILNVINQFLVTPLDLVGKKAAQLLSKKRRRRRRRSPSPDSDEGALSADEPKLKKRKEKKKKEKETYKSAQFIQDSDEEYGDMDAFLEKEKAARERAILAAASAGDGTRLATMKPTGTKKRRKKGANESNKLKKREKGKEASPASGDPARISHERREQESDVEVVEPSGDQGNAQIPKPRPLPRPIPKPAAHPRTSSSHSSPPPSSDPGFDDTEGDLPPSPGSPSNIHAPQRVLMAPHVQRTKRLILSDDED